jgi:RNase P subunit RPR2
MFENICQKCRETIKDPHKTKTMMDDDGFIHIYCPKCAADIIELIKRREEKKES